MLMAAVCAAAMSAGAPSGASGAVAGPAWAITAVSEPTHFAPGDSGDAYTVTAINVGDAATDGTPVTIADALPVGVVASGVVGSDVFSTGLTNTFVSSASCEQTTVTCAFSGVFDVGDSLMMTVTVSVESSLSGSVTDTATVSGGGAADASSTGSATIASTPAAFGVVQNTFDLATSGPQAGSHPNLTTSFALNRSTLLSPAGQVRNIGLDLPPGIVGSPTAVPQCDMSDLVTGRCPQDAIVGVATVTISLSGFLKLITAEPLYNIHPYADEPAAFAFGVLGEIPVRLDTSIRADGDRTAGGGYGLRVDVSNASASEPVFSTYVTLWGVPADHNGRGSSVFNALDASGNYVTFGSPGGGARTPLLSYASACGAGPLSANLSVQSWPLSVGGVLQPSLADGASSSLPAPTGCDGLRFEPSVSVLPDSFQAGVPASYTVGVRIPQNEDPEGLATPSLKDMTVSLPAGTVVSPSAADGLQGCSDEQFGLNSTAPASCPPASQVGTVEARTPVLAGPVEGQLFVGTPNCSPCTEADAQDGNMVRLLLQVSIPGATLKFSGFASADPVTGALTAHFQNLIQQPVSELKLRLKGGPRAPLANPQACGTATSTADLAPWSAPFTPDATLSSSFEVAGCTGDRFAPSLSAGTVNNQAGAFSPFTATFSRDDRDQNMGEVTLTTPPGLLGLLKGVERCAEPQAAQGTCGAGSLIGRTSVAAGPGPDPFSVQGGQVFLTGPYKGAPFGLSIVVPAVAGPFNLGTVVVRAAIHVDPHTAQITVASDPLPRILDGVPLQIKTVNVTIDRQGFIFNPTNCEALSVAGTLTSTQGTSANVSSHFQAVNCATLPFKPSFKVSTQANTSKKQGASLDVKVGYPTGAQANIRGVAVSLPKQLPARLTTVQQACLAATFNANPANCPAGSNIGVATASTPVLASPVSGPAYLVSHGGAAFPDLVVVLQGEGITLDLVGSIDIKHGVTSSAFASVPDAPISSFELKLPEGPHSGLAAVVPAKAKGSMCGQSLTMPTTLTGQNGAVVKQTTKIAVTGCAKTKKKPKHAKPKRTQRAHGKKKGGKK
jgi:hypothetical protein